MKRLLLLVLPLASFACFGALFPTPIREILDHPEQYDRRSVTIAGEVEGATNILVLRYYRVSDGTGTITVVTPRAVPKRGTKVKVRGVVHQAFAIGDQSLTILSEAED
jgi:hypothetical protein